MESVNSRCRQLCRHPWETKLMQKYEAEEAGGQETPRVSRLSGSGGVRLSQGRRNTGHFPSISGLCHLRCSLFSLPYPSTSRLKSEKKEEKISSCEQTQGLSQSPAHQCFRTYHIISNILPTEIQGEMYLHCFVTVVNAPQHNWTLVFLKMFQVI